MIYTDIYITSDGKSCEKYARRGFQQVPRVGEFVELWKDGSHNCAEVVRVQYGEIDAPPFEQTCVLIAKWEAQK